MRRQSKVTIKQSRPAEKGSTIIPSDIDGPLPDWRELGRRVLNESMRRSTRDMRRRNAGMSHTGRMRHMPGDRS